MLVRRIFKLKLKRKKAEGLTGWFSQVEEVIRKRGKNCTETVNKRLCKHKSDWQLYHWSTYW
jgi:hypothetical protein